MMIEIYDTTLRDGTQAENFSLTLEDKIRVALKLDEFGVDFIEGGWPGSNPKDEAFFREIRRYSLKHAVITAFGSTQQAKYSSPDDDPQLCMLRHAGTSHVTIFGKTWDIHVKDALKITLDRNLEIIESSVKWLKDCGKTVFYDAEHFFDGFKANSEYAIKTIKTAWEAGADCIVLCDTNGGTLTFDLIAIIEELKRRLSGAEANQMKTNEGIKGNTFDTDKGKKGGYSGPRLGIHCHNDSDLAVANSIEAVHHGITHVQGTINGFGERCGNANLCSIIPALSLKMGKKISASKNLSMLTALSRFVCEVANVSHNKYQPYVGESAFAHKGGVHVSAVRKRSETYEHIMPDLVGNTQRILISDLSGRSNIVAKARQFGLNLKDNDPILRELLSELKDLENQGFQFEAAEASFELFMRRAFGGVRKFFDLMSFRVIDQKCKEDDPSQAEATVMVRVGGKVEHTAACGNGPVNALDKAIRKALKGFYPEMEDMRLTDYKVRVLTESPGTGAKVRVLIECKDSDEEWSTIGVSHDIIEASWQALIDSITYKLMKSFIRSRNNNIKKK